MKSLWNEGKVSIVLFPSRELYDSVFVEMKKWTEDGLINHALWVFPENIEELELQPANIKSLVCGKNKDGAIETIEVDLFDQLARGEFEQVRLVAVRVLNNSLAQDEQQKRSLITLANYVEWTLPLPSARDGDKKFKTNLFKANLIIAPSQMHAGEFKLAAEETWDVNVIASPEDRSSPWSGDAFVRSDKKFSKFAAMHAASIGGLWSGVAKSPFDILERESSQRGQFWVSRVFVNAILTDGISRRITAQVLNEIADPNSDLFNPHTGVIIKDTFVLDDHNAEAYLNWMVDIVFKLENSCLSFNKLSDGEEPEKEKWFEWTQIKGFLIFSWDKVKVIPWWMWIWFRRLIGRKLTRTFQGEEGRATVGISQDDAMDSRDKLLLKELETLVQAESAAKKALITPFLKQLTKSSVNLWRDIRRLVFGMLDGSDLTRFELIAQDNRVPVFARVSQVIQNPLDKFEVSDEIRSETGINSISWENLEDSESILAASTNKLSEIKSKIDANLTKTVEIDSKIAEYQNKLASFSSEVHEVTNG
jgi:hypothetical protein